MKNPWPKILFSRLVWVLCSVLLACLVVEVYFRLMDDFPYPSPREAFERALHYEPAVFSRHILKQEQRTFLKLDNETRFSINSKGYRGPEFSIKKPEGVTRIIVFGGSTVFDLEQTEGKDWPHRVENNLNATGTGKYEVINAGVPGHASFDSLGRLFTRDYRFQPDYVLLYNAWNDLKHFGSKAPLLNTIKPHVPQSDLRLFHMGLLDRIFSENSKLYLYLRSLYLIYQYSPNLEGGARRLKKFSKPQKEVQPEALKQFELNIKMFVDLARNINAVPVLVTQATLVNSANSTEEREKILFTATPFEHAKLVQAFDLARLTILHVAADKDVDLIDAAAKLSGTRRYYSDHAHLTAAGSEALGNLVATELLGIIRKREDRD